MSELAPTGGWLLGSHTDLHWTLVWFGKCVIGTGTSPCFDKYACSTQNKSYQNIPSHLQERLSETLKRFWGGGKMGRWVRRCEGLAVEAAQDRGKLEKHKYGEGEKGGEPVET